MRWTLEKRSVEWFQIVSIEIFSDILLSLFHVGIWISERKNQQQCLHNFIFSDFLVEHYHREHNNANLRAEWFYTIENIGGSSFMEYYIDFPFVSNNPTKTDVWTTVKR